MSGQQPNYVAPIKYDRVADPTEIDPLEDINSYVAREWLQQLLPIRTKCYRCRKTVSPVVYVPFDGVIAFGDPVALSQARKQRRPDITDQVILAFAQIGWKFQKHKSYCPACKGLGL